MKYTPKLAWQGRWPLALDLSIQVRIFTSRPALYHVVFDYPPVALGGPEPASFTIFSPVLTWDGVHDFLADCAMTTGWEPAAPPADPPEGQGSPPPSAAAARLSRAIFRPRRRRDPAPATRRISARLAGARRAAPPVWALALDPTGAI